MKSTLDAPEAPRLAKLHEMNERDQGPLGDARRGTSVLVVYPDGRVESGPLPRVLPANYSCLGDRASMNRRDRSDAIQVRCSAWFVGVASLPVARGCCLPPRAPSVRSAPRHVKYVRYPLIACRSHLHCFRFCRTRAAPSSLGGSSSFPFCRSRLDFGTPIPSSACCITPLTRLLRAGTGPGVRSRSCARSRMVLTWCL